MASPDSLAQFSWATAVSRILGSKGGDGGCYCVYRCAFLWSLLRHTPQADGQNHSAGNAAGGGGALRKGLWLAVLGLGFSTLGAAAAWKTLTARGLGFYSDEESLGRFSAADADEEARRAEETINGHPLVAELRRRPELTESRPHMKMPAQYRAHSLTGAALLGPGKVPVPATTWTEAGGKSLVSVVYVGEDLCGHPPCAWRLLATMLDEGLAWCCFGALPHNIGVTANLNVSYRKPTPAGSFLVLRAKTTKVEGRKAWVKGHIELLAKPGEQPTVLVEADALYVSPKLASVSFATYPVEGLRRLAWLTRPASIL
ncbi:thioesterase family protein [Hirsutella rhossiliensis]|uniref:Thioesterase family protein n=1 Tax=Hirsutella rhossiliensis TaxID=111463 RepID=A0A9P8MRM0_9HYPO|nr:thioesterase family protein [Hirsutella rhossiliensis]KAH0960623.1 thioesterase family protein [Hirsutella rhossiliensis]